MSQAYNSSDLLDSIKERTLATIWFQENENNADTHSGRHYKEQARDRLNFARYSLSEELNFLISFLKDK